MDFVSYSLCQEVGRTIMADEPQVAVGPAIMPVSVFTASITPQEIMLTVGTQRTVLDAEGVPAGGITREWMATLAMSATSAKMLVEALRAGVEQYEATFGTIPMDPGFTLTRSGNIEEAEAAS